MEDGLPAVELKVFRGMILKGMISDVSVLACSFFPCLEIFSLPFDTSSIFSFPFPLRIAPPSYVLLLSGMATEDFYFFTRLA